MRDGSQGDSCSVRLSVRRELECQVHTHLQALIECDFSLVFFTVCGISRWSRWGAAVNRSHGHMQRLQRSSNPIQ